MANYYYARARVYVSTNDGGLSVNDLKNNKVKSNPVLVADASADGASKKQYAWYVIDVYKSTVASFAVWSTLPSSQLGNILEGDSKKATFILPNKDTQYATHDDVVYYSAAGRILYVDSHLEWTFSNNIGKPRSLTPTVTITQSDSGSGDVAVTNIFWDNTANKAPTIKFTGAAGAPTYPTDTVKTWINTQYGTAYAKTNITISSTTWSVCNKQWCYMVVDNKDASVTLWYSDENAKTFTMALGKKPAITDQPKRQSWNSQNAAAYTKAIDASLCKGASKVPPVIGSDYNVTVSPPEGESRYNPPPHAESRSVPYSIRNDKSFFNTHGDVTDATFNSIQTAANFYSNSSKGMSTEVYTGKGYSYLERGRIFQDKMSANVINGVPKKPNDPNQWGFRFMYNPNAITYTTQQSTKPIDYTLGSKDTASLLEGNQTINIELYINRVVDLSYLGVKYGRNATKKISTRQMSEQEAYGRSLSLDEREGILNRGTEYDLEFLYRCLTGNPVKNNPLLNDYLRKTGSANIGYITGIPLWLYLSDNMRYFGSISGFSLNHLIFNTEMVPTLSVLSLSFSRYPAQFANEGGLAVVHNNFFPAPDPAAVKQ